MGLNPNDLPPRLRALVEEAERRHQAAARPSGRKTTEPGEIQPASAKYNQTPPTTPACLAEEAAKKKRHQEAGRRARAQGVAPEVALKVLHLQYQAEHRALVRKLETPVRRVSMSGRGEFRAVFLERAGVDFSGWVSLGGRAVPVDLELKTTEKARIDLDEVAEHQAAQLQATHDAGGLALVLARVDGTWWLVPWGAWRAPADAPERKSLNTVALAACAARCETVLVQIDKTHTDLAPDWLPALARIGAAHGS